jgi:hypothetical protein
MKEKIVSGSWAEEKLNGLIASAAKVTDIGERIAFLSGQFIGASYEASTLIGDATIPERLVINVETFDCFTFLDCIEAMRLSQSLSDFHKNLIRVRYKEGIVGYEKRNHFFTDWPENNADFIQDRTNEIGGRKVETVIKNLNCKNDSSCFLPGIRPFERAVSFIPSVSVRKRICQRIKTGDYVGIYSDLPGLDVSHVGIVVKEGPGICFRHASSALQTVVDQDFSDYISGKPGIIILRPY